MSEIFADYFDFIFQECCEKLSKSKDLNSFLVSEFGSQDIYIQDGVYSGNQPSSEGYPIIAFSEIDNAKFGFETTDNDFLLTVGVAIKNSTLIDGERFEEEIIPSTPTTPNSIVRKTIGKRQVGRFWMIVVQEILSLSIGAKIKIVGKTSFTEIHPIFKFEGNIMFSFHRSLRTKNPLSN